MKHHQPVPPLQLDRVTLLQVFSHKHLGVTLTPNLSWNEHISNIIAKANKRLCILKAFKYQDKLLLFIIMALYIP